VTRLRIQRLLAHCSVDAALQLAERFECLDPAFQQNLENLYLFTAPDRRMSVSV
jgi:hypothetical protein